MSKSSVSDVTMLLCVVADEVEMSRPALLTRSGDSCCSGPASAAGMGILNALGDEVCFTMLQSCVIALLSFLLVLRKNCNWEIEFEVRCGQVGLCCGEVALVAMRPLGFGSVTGIPSSIGQRSHRKIHGPIPREPHFWRMVSLAFSFSHFSVLLMLISHVVVVVFQTRYHVEF